MKKYFANYKFPALTSIGIAALGLLLILIGWCTPWFTTSLGDTYLLDGALAGGSFPVACVQAFAFLATFLCIGAVAVLFFAPVAKRKAFKALQYAFLAFIAVMGVLALVFAIVFAKNFGEETKALGGAYLLTIGTLVTDAALCFKRISKRRLIQVYAALLFNANLQGYSTGIIYKGRSKYACVPGLNCYSCPGAVGACPLGALQNAMANSSATAPYYVIGIILLFGLLLGRTVCGWLCPVGLGQELLYKIPTPKLKKNRYTRIFSYLKYFFLAVFVIAIPLMYGLFGVASTVPAFCKYICPAGTFGGGVGLLINPENSGWFATLGPLFTWKFALMVAVILGCIFCYRGFCRFICPLGALYGFFNRIALIGVKLDKNKCTDCGLCIAHCKMDIKKVGDHECISCGECISVCPAKAISFKGGKLLLHANAVEGAAPAEEKPLGAFLSSAAPAASGAIAAPTAPMSNFGAPVSEVSPSERAETTAEKRKKPASFWVRLGAWCALFAVLAGALIYYNVIAEQPTRVGIEVGDICPDFTIRTYGFDDDGEYKLLEETFTLSEYRDKIIVLNFWATWCGPCVAELPHFAQLKANYPEIVVVAIYADVHNDLPNYLVNEKGWHDNGILFAQDVVSSDGACLVYDTLGGVGSLPMTLVLDRDGVITFTLQNSVTYQMLAEQIEKVL